MGTNQADTTGKLSLTPLEKDAIGEVMNISMGSAATAVSQMLDRQVEITTPTVAIQTMESVKYEKLEPAVLVKIVYTTGLSGTNVMVFRQHDMQMILNVLMGISEEPSEDFVFDELSISAACEVMNQMMGSSATALADFLDKKIDISTPTASVMEEDTFQNAMELAPETEIVTITFKLTIKGMLESEFISVLEADLVKEIISRFIGEGGDLKPVNEPPAPEAAAAPAAEPEAAAPAPQEAPPPAPAAAPLPPPAAVAPPPAAMAPPPVQAAPPPAAAYAPPPPQPAYAAQPAAAVHTAVAYAPPVYMPPPPVQNPVDVRPVEFPEFSQGMYSEGAPVMGTNLDLIMNVPLAVSIEIGTTKKKIRDIMNFTAGTVVELDKQAGSPVDIVVNGQLIAHGDVVVIDDNFGVRITEIVGTKELINSLSETPS